MPNHTSISAPLPGTLTEAHAEIAALRAALVDQQKLARIPAQNPNPIYRLGPNQQRLFANPAADRLATQLAPVEQDMCREVVFSWAMESLATGEEIQRQLQVGNRYFAAHIVPFKPEQYVNMYLTEQTALVLAQQEQAAQQSFMERVLDTAPVVVFVRDADGRYVFKNAAARALWEQMTEPASTPEVAATQAKEQAGYAASDAEVLASGEQRVVEVNLTLPSGEKRCLQTIKQLLRWENGEPHVLGVSTDVTELKRATDAATAAAKARENFLANMSHEIRTPLNGVLGMAGQLAKTPLNMRQQELVGIIQHSGKHLLGVINDVLDMAKITSGKLELAQDAFDICEMLFQAASPLLQQAQEKGITVVANRLQDSCPNPRVVGDLQRLSQIILNLLSNAIKFTPPGGQITASGYQVAETPDTLTIEFSFADTGVGIAPDKLERIFENFTQAYADTSRHFGGTGLGLSISRALVERMGGKLNVVSEVGKGSTFSFCLTLPRAKETPVAAAPVTTDYDTGALRGKRLLLVEDNDINRLVARMLLEEWGAQLDEAEDGASGLAYATDKAYDAVLMDIQMPGMSGLEATVAIRALPDAQRAEVPILALTANAFQSDTEQYLAAGMNDCVAKPFDEAELYGKLAALVR
ncbi:ATP-binding protein [Hymenobacter koreensis]|uniref:histidine kinase n=1 Tax=Hymenobacter koreensis TaxID=1084523 RepID=A0ABP8IZD2_9BACT